jgi:hypothetical protein
MRALGQNENCLKDFMDRTDDQTNAFVTSNGINRFTAFRIDMQAYYVGTIFAALSIFGQLPTSTLQLAMQAIAF